MKQVFIIIRPNMYFETKKSLVEHNFLSMSVKDVVARFCETANFEYADGNPVNTDIENPFVAKKMIEIFCRDEDLDNLIETVLDINKTGHEGDGKIWVVDIVDAERVRTGEKGINALM